MHLLHRHRDPDARICIFYILFNLLAKNIYIRDTKLLSYAFEGLI